VTRLSLLNGLLSRRRHEPPEALDYGRPTQSERAPQRLQDPEHGRRRERAELLFEQADGMVLIVSQCTHDCYEVPLDRSDGWPTGGDGDGS